MILDRCISKKRNLPRIKSYITFSCNEYKKLDTLPRQHIVAEVHVQGIENKKRKRETTKVTGVMCDETRSGIKVYEEQKKLDCGWTVYTTPVLPLTFSILLRTLVKMFVSCVEFKFRNCDDVKEYVIMFLWVWNLVGTIYIHECVYCLIDSVEKLDKSIVFQ